MLTKFEDALIGFAIGDAIGVPVEFISREKFKRNPIVDMKGNGIHNQPIGTWSDNTSMTIATIDSIISKETIDYNDIMNNFRLWRDSKKFTATGTCFDIGNTCNIAIIRFNGKNALECGLNDTYSNGNGSLMRMLAIPFWCYFKGKKKSEIFEYVKNISSLTHAHEISILGCYIYTIYVMSLLAGMNKKASYEMIKKIDYSIFSQESVDVYKRIIEGDIQKLELDEIKSSGYVVDTLEAVLWTVLNTNNYKDSILTAVNMGEDTDTIAAIVGGITGILYGMESVPLNWLENLKKKEYLINLSRDFDKLLLNYAKYDGTPYAIQAEQEYNRMSDEEKKEIDKLMEELGDDEDEEDEDEDDFFDFK